MTADGTPEGTRVELFARESLPAAATRRRDSVMGRLTRLADDGHVSAVEIHTWDKKVPVEGDTLENLLYERFAAWAAEVGVDLEPFFDTRECYSLQTGERGDRLVMPTLCLAVYRDGDLQSVYPHSTNGDSRSVMDGLHALESGPTRTDDSDDTDEAIVEAAD